MQMDDEGLTLGMNLLTECLAGFRQSGEASSCPRLKRRLPPPWPESVWMDLRKRRPGGTLWCVSGDGARLTLAQEYLDGDQDATTRAGACRHVMSSGKH
eukprot:COSAG04_NODE_26266_length_297_cov_0.772727_1_plen_98_part_11